MTNDETKITLLISIYGLLCFVDESAGRASREYRHSTRDHLDV